MLWRGGRESGNVQDRRGMGGLAVGGGIGATVIAVIMYFFGGGSAGDLVKTIQGNGEEQTQGATTQQNDEASKFVKVVLGYTEDTWHQVFRDQLNKEYTEPALVLFSNSTQSGCGFASAQTGPFYCPGDSKVYIDLSFYNQLQERFNAPGDFAMAYVIAHEVGHHVQNLLGISDEVHNQRQGLSETEYNRLSVKLELQADFLAGVWAHHTQQMKNILEAGDIEEALNAANAIGDDRLQKQSQGQVVPDAFTHGTSAQRMKWFKKGFDTGDLRQGDTFNTTDL
jgi:predicted metalloprotease